MVVSTRPRQDRSQNVIVLRQAPSMSRTISAAGLGAVGGMVTEYLFDPELAGPAVLGSATRAST
ncbi:hypothetical protein [Microbispora sp. GKU 823]|uniref:hypothetical protein n=1 Tax=Microbispora sp. GKU 823 TaxID=1652100 RepID=UPI0009D17481|nr:hypothetical protein [Microbispora sp. GKU 823]OPG02921.1 hypothetical protein B1L11_41455 [Microbispora sp. GKU 823]